MPDHEEDIRAAGRHRGGRWSRFRHSKAPKWIALAGAILLFAAASAWYTCGFRGCPNPEALLAYEPGGAPIVLDRNGDKFATLLAVQREVADIDSLSDYVGNAFIAVEDQRFRSHHGIDLRRIGGALLADIRKGGAAEGASTITMQLARNAFPDKLPASQRTLGRKISETRVAVAIEHHFTKDQILGLYLNQIYFGHGATGIAAASREYFGVPPAQLQPAQAAMLAAMVKAPAHYDPREDTTAALERRNLVLRLMHEQGYLTDAQYTKARDTPLEVVPEERSDERSALPAPWFLDAVRRRLDDALGSDLYRTQVKVHTTLDPDLQHAAEAAMADQLHRVEEGKLGAFKGPRYDRDTPPDSAGSAYLQGAIVVVGAKDGDVLALVGGRDYRRSSFDRVFDARRQVGSAFKPFVYGAAVEQGIPPSHPLLDAPLTIPLKGAPAYTPTNYDNAYVGRITAREALRHSRNVPTVRLAQEVGTGAVANFAHEAGLEGDIPDGPSMALGTVAVSPMDLARAYTTFAGLGQGVEPRFITSVETGDGRVLWTAPQPRREERIQADVAYVVDDMLEGVIDGGTGSAVRSAGFRGTAAGKTGTTQDNTDAWFVGYTPALVGVVWIGFDQPRPILPNASGGLLAAPVWGRMMSQGGRTGSDWTEPPGVARLPYDPATGHPYPQGCGAASGAPTDLFLEDRMNPEPCPAGPAPVDTSGGPLQDSLGAPPTPGGLPSMDTLGGPPGGRGDSLPIPPTLSDSARRSAPTTPAQPPVTPPRQPTTPRSTPPTSTPPPATRPAPVDTAGAPPRGGARPAPRDTAGAHASATDSAGGP